jgi:hypothetical protein
MTPELGTHFVSDPGPSVPYPAYLLINGGYHASADLTTHYGSPFAMSISPVVSQTPQVYNSAPEEQLPFASTAFTPFHGTNSPPVGLGMVSASVPDNATTPSIHHINLSALPQPSSELVPEVPAPPVVRCEMDACRAVIPISKTALRKHLTIAQGYPTQHRSHSVVCRWANCLCTRPSSCRTLNLPLDHGVHGVHVEDITEHIWAAHLNFQDVCSKCGDARWARGFSFQRHTIGCAGRKPARCKECRQIFRSTIALAGHIELGQCEAALFGQNTQDS